MHLLTYLSLRCTDLYNDTSQLLFLFYFKSVVMEVRTKHHSFCWSTRIQLKPCLLRGNLHVHPYSETPSSTLPSASSETMGMWHSMFEGSSISEEWNAPHTVFSAWKWNNTIIKTVICYHKDVKAKKKKYSKDIRTIRTRNVCYFLGTGLRALPGLILTILHQGFLSFFFLPQFLYCGKIQLARFVLQ